MTAPNAALAYRVLDTARAHQALRMGEWADGPEDFIGLAELTAEESCGTTACLAGWTAALAGYKITNTGVAFDQHDVNVGAVRRIAADLLGIDFDDSEFLFFVHDDYLDEAMESIFGPRPEGDTCPNPACGHASSLHQQHGCVGHHGLCRCDWRPDGGEGGSVTESAS